MAREEQADARNLHDILFCYSCGLILSHTDMKRKKQVRTERKRVKRHEVTICACTIAFSLTHLHLGEAKFHASQWGSFLAKLKML